MSLMINEEKRNILYTGVLNDQDTSKIMFFILNESKGTNKEPIHLYINSNGGDVTSTLSLIDVIRKTDIPVYTYNMGICFSAAFYLFLAGEKRFTTKTALFMYHQITISFDEENILDLEEYININKDRQKILEKFIVSRTSIKRSTLQEINECRKDWFFNRDTAFDFNIVTDDY